MNLRPDPFFADGQRYDNDYVFVIHFRDGKIARYEEYCDTELITRIFPDRIAAKAMLKTKPT
ncbi:nuclear transport factor 2 family protein [Undibacterium sp. Di27W]|uniref:nuclear transport factor 2 family protein n=1 Tax=Undibacterium sp. Di27W TaxID=3413036 RepID=UPI003BF1F975